MQPEILKINVGLADLVVEVYNSDYPVPEICIYLNDENSMQDIAIIRKSTNADDAVECIVYADEKDEDYTHKFTIKRYKFESD